MWRLSGIADCTVTISYFHFFVQSYLWTMERNLDIDLDCQEDFAEEDKTEKERNEKGAGKRRHSLANFLHLN